MNLAIGSSKIQFNDILSYVTGHTNTKATFLIHNVRMPRMLAGLIIGGALAIAGLLMQAITKNPLAHPQIFGVNAGASFVIVLITVLIPSLGSYSTILAIIGAFLGGFTVYTLSGSTKSITPIKLALAGMAIHLFFSSMTQGIIILNEDSNDTVMFWLVGSLAGIKWQQIIFILPFYSLLFCDHIYGKTINYIRVRMILQRIRTKNRNRQNDCWNIGRCSCWCFCFYCWAYRICRFDSSTHSEKIYK